MFTEKVSLTVFVSTCISFSRDDGSVLTDVPQLSLKQAQRHWQQLQKPQSSPVGFWGFFACPWSPVNIYRLTVKQGDRAMCTKFSYFHLRCFLGEFVSPRNLNNFLEGFSSEVLGCYSVFPHLPAAVVSEWKQIGAQTCCSGGTVVSIRNVSWQW